MRLRSVLRIAPAFVSPFLACAFVFVLACAGQQEGQVCSTYNGNADCANGLVCTALMGVNGSRCCPANRDQSTTVTCGTPSDIIATDSAAPPFDGASLDGQPSEASASEAATDDDAGVDGAAVDGAAATATDAATDAQAPEASADAASE